MSTDIPGSPFDLAIAQGAFMHFSDLHAVLARVATLLRPGGRLVIEDGVILTPPSMRADKAALEELLHYWNGTFQREEHWRDLLQRTGFHVDQVDDLTAVADADFEHLLTATEVGRVAGVTAEERRAWQLALRLSHAGHLGTVRIVGTRLPLSSTVRITGSLNKPHASAGRQRSCVGFRNYIPLGEPCRRQLEVGLV